MSNRYDIYRRVNSRLPFGDLQRGFHAEIHDPVWFLGRQWQMGEHQGEDASSPVEVAYQAEQIPLDGHPLQPHLDPTIVPPEAIVESEPDDWWLPSRRIRLGKAYADAHSDTIGEITPAPLLDGLPFPYNRFNGKGYDGQKLHALILNALIPDDPVFDEVPNDAPVDLWNPTELVYQTDFTAGNGAMTLSLDRHDGGEIDWYSVDGTGALAAGPPVEPVQVLPTHLHYPGAPHPRWWQIENGRVDIGGFPPDRGHFATMLLIDLISSHTDDWFTFPIDTEVGTIIRLQNVEIKDSFDDTWTVTPPAGWSLFKVTGLDDTALLVWPTVATPLTGSELEDVAVGVDEDANLLWAVELRVHGRDLPTEGLGELQADSSGNRSVYGENRQRYRYAPAIGARRYWHPYSVNDVNGQRRFVQGRLANLENDPPDLFPEPQASLLIDQANYTADPANQTAPVHQIEPGTVPSNGLRLKRRWMLVRQTDGLPQLWVQRQRLPLMAPPSSGLRFDVFEQLPVQRSV